MDGGMPNEKNANKRKKSSTTSLSDSSFSNSFSVLSKTPEDTEFKETFEQESKSESKKSTNKKKNKKRKTMASLESVDLATSLQHVESNIEKKLDKIDEKLSNVLTKEDRSFIKAIIKDTVEEMKEQLLASVVKRVDILESDLHSKSDSTSKLSSEIKANKMAVEKKLEQTEQQIHNENNALKQENEKLWEISNDQEQYSRRNNLRVVGIQDDKDKQSSTETTTQFLAMCKEKMGLEISAAEIDIAHRIGQYKTKINRPIIVKFVRRQTKINILKAAKALKGTRIFLNDDLTHTNQQVLMSLRLKAPKRIASAWTFEGKIFATFSSTNPQKPLNTTTRQIRFMDFDYWLSMPWPERKQ